MIALSTYVTVFSLVAMFEDKPPGPIDAYMANYASVKANVEFEFTAGKADYGRARSGQILKSSGFDFDRERIRTLVGRWSCDGEAERLRCEPLVKDLSQYPKWGSGYLHYVSPFDLLFNSQKAAFISNVRDIINLSDTDTHSSLVHGRTPFFRWSGMSLHQLINKEFGHGPTRLIHKSLFGFPVEMEIYESDTPEKWIRLEVAYDPSIGYLPRFARKLVSIDAAKSHVQVWENWLVDARRCIRSGGFVPIDWYEFFLSIRGFRQSYPNYDTDTMFEASPLRQVHVGHYKVNKFSERVDPASLDDIGGIRIIGTFGGGTVPVQKGLRQLTLSQISSIASRSTSENGRVVALKQMQGSIDREDASRFDGNPDGQKWERGWYVLLGLTLILVIFVIHRWRLRSSSVLLFAMILLAAGCGSDRKPVILLRASLDNSKLISPRKTAPIKLRACYEP